MSALHHVTDGHDLGDRPIAVEDADHTAALDVGQVPTQVVLELGYHGLFHMAIMAISGTSVKSRGSATFLGGSSARA